MVSCNKVLRKKARKLELKGLEKNKITSEHLSGFEELLHDVYLTRIPKSSDYCLRRDLVRIFNEIAKEIYGNSSDIPVVEGFGSFLMGSFSAKSDLDLSVNFRDNAVEFPRDKKIRTLRKFAKKLYALQKEGHVSGVHPITTAMVPILKVVDCGTGIECDLSVENRDGILKSQIICLVSSIDERFQKLCFLMKAWAKVHNINSSKCRTLNSLSITLLVAFHLQTRDPPILPPFSALFGEGTDPANVAKVVNQFLNYGKKNKETLAELFVYLLIKLASIETLWPKGLCASTYEGSWIYKTWDSKLGCISVEDFTDRAQNVARAVGSTEVNKIYKCINHSIHYVLAFMNGQIENLRLKKFLFGLDPMLAGSCTADVGKNAMKPHVPLDRIRVKRMRLKEGWGGGNSKGWEGGNSNGWEGTQARGWGEGNSKGCEGTNAKAWGGANSNGWEGKQAKDGGEGNSKGWEGTNAKGWGGANSTGWEMPPAQTWGGANLKGWDVANSKGWGGANIQI